MPKISALIHAHNDALRIGRALDSLRACDEVVVVDHASSDDTVEIARKHGAVIKHGLPGVEPGAHLMDARHDWVLCIYPNEAVNEGLEASLLEFRQHDCEDETAIAYNLTLREENGGDWQALPAETRLADRTKLNWMTKCPPHIPEAPSLTGELLRFEEPGNGKSA